MTCHELAQQITQLHPELDSIEVARMCLLILSQSEAPEELLDPQLLDQAWSNASFRFDSAVDQHAAVSVELTQCCADGPESFSPDQLWILLRAVRVQSQILDLFIDQPALV